MKSAGIYPMPPIVGLCPTIRGEAKETGDRKMTEMIDTECLKLVGHPDLNRGVVLSRFNATGLHHWLRSDTVIDGKALITCCDCITSTWVEPEIAEQFPHIDE